MCRLVTEHHDDDHASSFSVRLREEPNPDSLTLGSSCPGQTPELLGETRARERHCVVVFGVLVLGASKKHKQRRKKSMTGKAKPKKHTAKEIAAKIDAATTNRGGGKEGLADRKGVDKGGHAKLACPICKAPAPDSKSMRIHHDARHPKLPYEEEKLINLHASTGSSGTSTSNVTAVEEPKPKPGVRGSLKKL